MVDLKVSLILLTEIQKGVSQDEERYEAGREMGEAK